MSDTKQKYQGLYHPSFEKDNCGFGLMAHMDGKPSHWLVQTAIEALGRMTHRGAIAADGKTGDGCGLLIKKPEGFLKAVAGECGIELTDGFGVGVVFLSQDEAEAEAGRQALAEGLKAEGLMVAGWRVVPTNSEACGESAKETQPRIEQVFVNRPATMGEVEFEVRLYVARRRAEKAREAAGDAMFYLPTLSTKVLSYKGMVMPEFLPVFYPDLGDARMETAICVFHQRFATNTLPQWRLAQPFRYLAHNGEINTIRGNRNWARARSYTFSTDNIPDMDAVRPWVSMEGSDSSSLDNMLEALMAGGVDIFRAMRLLIPPAWQNVSEMDPDLRAFYEYNSMHMEPWDGPAGIVLTDGRYAACSLDRNGLRPARYVITKPDIATGGGEVVDNDYSGCVITLASEIGVYGYDNATVIKKGRLKPGQMLAADTENARLILPEEVDKHLKQGQPYKEWMKNATRLESKLQGDPLSDNPMEAEELKVYQKLFQLSFEERDQIIRVLAEGGAEAVSSMGDDAPYPVMSHKLRSVFDNFRQMFAQVTNPPIDPIREEIVMSLETLFGSEKNLFDETPEHAKRLIADSPVLSEGKFRQLLAHNEGDFAHAVIDLNYPADFGLRAAITDICDKAIAEVKSGKTIIILSDRNIAKNTMPVHAALATGALHHRLIREGERCNANIVVQTGTTRDPHHFAVLLGFGATAVYPYLAFEAIYDLARSGEITEQDVDKLGYNYRKGINKGLYKVMSKMGISSVASYRGAQLFEIVGLNDEVVDLCFNGTTSRIQGADFSDLETDVQALAKIAWNPRKAIDQGGLLKYVEGGEAHAYNPDVIRTIHKAVNSGDWNDYQEFAAVVNNRPPMMLRDLFKLREDITPISIDEVEAEEELFKRFDTAAMSLGALSPEAHEALAIAMNRLGGRSNSGEGGEDPKRYVDKSKFSKIKQVASGRFGVTPGYLVNAEVLQIKVAQGAKPGEGGQLPGHKVNDEIARLRYTRPGVPLISPPPHHDIYSIEDLAQLIFDLKQINPEALVSVKLVSEPGVGTIAAGVAKAYADLITISGYDGGTAASPTASVKYAGSPWELGLSETHQVLKMNDLRGKVRVQTDGGLKTGLDVIKAAILGAESFGFGTMPMVVLGCKYLRICHLNNCATGVATQNDVLRAKHYKGKPELVETYFRFVAREVREWLAKLGVPSLEALIGRTDLLEILPGDTPRQQKLDLTPITEFNAAVDGPNCCVEARNMPFDEAKLAEQMVADTLSAIESKSGGEFSYHLENVNRSVGARVSGEIAKRHDNLGMADSPITLKLTGTAGQSFGVWNAGGLHMYLDGDANDYVGKGMAGGKLVIRPPADSRYATNENTIIGNTCLYGATGGKLFAAGMAGERFGVRNSGAHAVVEAAGDHCGEYMTGGVITVLGPTGVNFGAGLTGGFAFVLDEENKFAERCNGDVDFHRINTETTEAHRNFLREMIAEYVEETGSAHGKNILDNFDDFIGKFWLVKPKAAELETLLEVMLERAA